MPWFDAITSALGQQNPYDEARAWADEAQRRNRVAVGLDANGDPLPANWNPAAPAAADPGNPVNNGQSAAMGQALATGVQQPGQQPQATKTDPSLGHILMDMTQYQQREQGFNQAMGAGFAAFSQPRDREWVSKIFNVNEPDATKLMQQTQDLASQQQGQDRMNSLGALISGPQGDAIAQRLNISKAELIARYRADPQGVGTMIQQFASPTDALKNLQQIQTLQQGAAQKGANSSEIGLLTPALVAAVGPEFAQKAIEDAAAYRASHNGQSAPWVTPNGVDVGKYNIFQANEQSKESDRATASASLSDNNETAMRLQNDLETLKDSPGLKSILTTSGKRAIAQQILKDPNQNDAATILANNAGLTGPEADAIALLKRVGGATTETAMKGMAGTGTRVTQAEVGPLKDAITTTQNLNQSYEFYIHSALNSAITRAKRSVATNFGATGNLRNMDSQYAPWLDDNFKPGGELYKEGSGASLPAAGAVPPDELATVKAVLKDKPYLKDEALDNWQQRGFDTKKLRHSSPSSW